MKTLSRLALSALNSFSSQSTHSQKGSAMKNTITATIFVASSLISPFAFAQAPAPSASASASVSAPAVPPPPVASASASATPPAPPAPASAPASPFLTQKKSEGLTQFQLFASIVGEFSKRMSAGAQGAFDETAGKLTKPDAKKMRAGIGNLPKGIADEIDIAVGKNPRPRTPYDAYLTTKACTKTAEGTKDNGGVETWSPGCAALMVVLVPIADRAIAAAPDSPAKMNAIFLMDIAKGMASQAPAVTDRSDLMIALVHYALLMLPPEFWPFENDLTCPPTGGDPCPPCDSIVGKQACFLKAGKRYCGKITAVTADGVEVDGESIPFDELMSGKAKPTWADEYPITAYVDLFGIWGVANGYTNPYILGVLACGAYNAHDNIDIHGCIGGGAIGGTSKVGVNPGDSSGMPIGKIGTTIRAGKRSWPVVPVIGLDALINGAGPGGQGSLGVQIWPSGPAEIRLEGVAGCYATNKIPQTHPDPNVSVSPFTLCGGGASLKGGFSF